MKKGKASANIVMVIVIVWLMIPLLATIIYSLFEDWTGIVPRGFTLANYQKIFSDPAFLTSMYQTVIVCAVPIAITILVMLLALFWKRLTYNGALAGIIAGFVVDALWYMFMGKTLIYEIIPGFLAGLLAAWLVSLLDKRPSEEITALFEKSRYSL